MTLTDMTLTRALAPWRKTSATGIERARRAGEFGPVRWLTLSGGLLATVGGVGHTIASALMRRDVWKQIARERFRKTVSLSPAPDRMPIAEAFWFTPGSFGVPLLLLGTLVTRFARHGIRVPGWVGGSIIAWAAVLTVLSGFDIGSAIILMIGVLLLLGGLPARRASSRGVEPR